MDVHTIPPPLRQLKISIKFCTSDETGNLNLKAVSGGAGRLLPSHCGALFDPEAVAGCIPRDAAKVSMLDKATLSNSESSYALSATGNAKTRMLRGVQRREKVGPTPRKGEFSARRVHRLLTNHQNQHSMLGSS